MWNITWAVKASKLCNLRCRYCYEWDDLGNPARIPVDRWARILTAARRYHDLHTVRFGGRYRSAIVWHGGEPLLLPRPYLEEVVALEHAVLGTDGLACREFVNYIQTNLYSLDQDTLDLLHREGFEVGVSFDAVPAVRVTSAGDASEHRVLQNLARVRQRGLTVRGCVVLARHTRPRLRQVYDRYETLGLPFSVFPLARAPVHALPDVSLDEGEMTAALADLFEYWVERRCSVEVEPLRSCLQTVLMQMTGLSRLPYDRSRWGDRAFVVDTDGTLYASVDRYVPGRSLGNLFEQTIDEILASPAYGESLGRDDVIRNRRCRACEYAGACDTYPAFALEEPQGARCRIAFELQSFIRQHLLADGVAAEDLVARAAKLVS